jgi:TonB-dependent receptor
MNRTPIGRAVHTALALATMSAALATQTAYAQVEPAEDMAAADAPGSGAIEEIVVTGRQLDAVQAVLEERMKLDVAADLISNVQISRVGDSTVSLALRRLPAVTVVQGQYIYIRGLGERYSSTTLNGAYVPSPDLTRNVIPLDLFPSEVVETLSVQKGYSPDKPAAFGGGNVDIRTLGIPDRFVGTFQIGTGWNSDSTGKDGLTYRGGSDDNLGTDDGTRALPSTLSRAIDSFQGDISPAGIYGSLIQSGADVSYEDAQQVNRALATSLYRDLDFKEQKLDPDLTFEGALGNYWTFGDAGDWRFGALAVVDYKNEWRNRDRTTRSVTYPDTVVTHSQRTINQVVLTGNLSAGLEYTDDHKVQANYIYLRNTEDESTLSIGNNLNFQQASGDQLRGYGIRYEERELEVLQFRGSHTFGGATQDLVSGITDADLGLLDGFTVGWYYSDATAKTDLPTEVRFSAADRVVPETGELISTSIRATSSAAEYRYTKLEDEVTSYGFSLDWPTVFGDVELVGSGGYDYYEKGRSYLQTQFNLGTTTNAALPILVGTPSEVFTDENILNPANGFQLSLGGIGTESYLAGETVDAAWGKVDATWQDTWRLMAGVRWEDWAQLSVPVNQYEYDTTVGKIPIAAEDLTSVAKVEDDYYPAVALTYMRDDFWADRFQLRFGWSETVARPDLREVSDASFIDPLTEARVRGNPDLQTSPLSNFDIRGEWFFNSGDNYTVSLFYKAIDNPIETIQGAGTDDNISLTFVNGDSADVYGVEFEWLKDLRFVSGERDWARGFFFSGNLTLSDSEITIGNAALNLTNNSRPMSQHSPWVVNLELGWDSPNDRHAGTLAYSAFDDRLFFAGSNGAKDAYEQSFGSLDLIYSYYPIDGLSLRFRLQNLLDDEIEIEQGGVTILKQTLGVNAKFDISYEF